MTGISFEFFLLGLLVLIVLLVLACTAWFLVTFTSKAAESLNTSKEVIAEQVRLVDKLVTLVVSADPMTYQMLRASDSLVGYDNGSSSDTTKEIVDVYEEDDRTGFESGEFGDPFFDGTVS